MDIVRYTDKPPREDGVVEDYLAVIIYDLESPALRFASDYGWRMRYAPNGYNAPRWLVHIDGVHPADLLQFSLLAA